ncbi:sel1 repeat family protein [Polynucleobacter sp. MWH-CaK5]|uniref:SEL1-like repeat protein n=1 Tax=Polynucleobacter sp. MWH-CaK5 TaxID=2689107 RepID=UPI001BFE12DC|nr:SEL1-like repeat protein [Polynucleobacter sp. MWH-CaK5]QWD89029.1 sel1 repeat family protein [Polynucleobacter sp. MWH-CaK5]
MKLARSGDALAQQKIGHIYMLGDDGVPKNSQNALLWLEKASVSIGFNDEIFNFVADHLELTINLSSSQAPFAWKCLLLAANTGHTRARWLMAQAISQFAPQTNQISQTPITALAFAQMSEKNWSDAGGLESFLTLAHRYLEELADLSSFNEQASAKKLLAQCLQDGRLGTLDVDRSKKIIASLATQSNDIGLSSLLSLGFSFSQGIDASLVPALKMHLPSLLSNKKHQQKHLPIYWAGWQQLQNADALEIAAELGYVPAQLAMGLRLAKLDTIVDEVIGNDKNVSTATEAKINSGNARLKRAVYWLKLAANHGEREAWYALGLINRMPQYSGYSAEDSDLFFDKAADLGHPQAQYRKGAALWRKRAQLSEEVEGLQASYWVWHATQQGVPEAQELLSKIMESHSNPKKNDWHQLASAVAQAMIENSHRFTGEILLMCHRVIVANQLNLSKAELLLANIAAIQHEHGAVVDIRAELPRSTPRLILIETLEQRKALMMASKAFANAELSNSLDEGNLRQRRYRLEKLMEMVQVK